MRKTAGFTLMEIVISLVILSTLSVGLAGFFVYAHKGSYMSDEKIIAVQAAEKALAELKGISSIDFQNYLHSDSSIEGGNYHYRDVAVPGLQDGRLTVKVGAFPTGDGVPPPEYKELIAGVNWTNAAGLAKNVRVVTGLYKVSNG